MVGTSHTKQDETRPSESDDMYDSTSKRWYYVMSVFLESNGLLNTLVYAWQSGFLSRSQDRARFLCDAQDTASQLPLAVSFNVAFRSSIDVAPSSQNELASLRFDRGTFQT